MDNIKIKVNDNYTVEVTIPEYLIKGKTEEQLKELVHEIKIRTLHAVQEYDAKRNILRYLNG